MNQDINKIKELFKTTYQGLNLPLKGIKRPTRDI